MIAPNTNHKKTFFRQIILLACLFSIFYIIFADQNILSFFSKRICVKVNSSKIRQEIGNAYSFEVNKYIVNDKIGLSKLILYEDDKALIPHNFHETIRSQGKGAFSHWDGYVLFSSSDNSDPRMNCKQYSIVYNFTPPLFLIFIPLLFIAYLGKDRTVVDYLIYLCIIFTIFLLSNLFFNNSNLKTNVSLIIVFSYIISIILFFSTTIYHLLPVLNRESVNFKISFPFLVGVPLFFIIHIKNFHQLAQFCSVAFFSTKMLLLFAAIFISIYFRIILLILIKRVNIKEFNLFNRVKDIFGINYGYQLLILIIIAFWPRLALFINYFDVSPIFDARSYDLDAIGILKFGTLSYSMTMPLAIYFYSLIYYIFGHYWWIAQFINILMNISACFIFSIAIYKVFKSEFSFLLSFLLFSISFSKFNLTHVLLTENMLIFLLSLIFYFFVKLLVLKEHYKNILILGILSGLLVLTRFQGFGFIIGIILNLFLLKELTINKKIKACIIFMFFILICLLPWGVHNLRLLGKFQLTSNQTASAFWRHNHPDAPHGLIFGKAMAEIIHKETMLSGGKVLTSQKHKELNRACVNHYFKHPNVFIKRALDRLLCFLGLIPDTFFLEPDGWKRECKKEIIGTNYYLKRFDLVVFYLFIYLGLFIYKSEFCKKSLILVSPYIFLLIFYSIPIQRIRWPVEFFFMIPYIFILNYPIFRNSAIDGYDNQKPLICNRRKILLIAICLFIISVILHFFWGRNNIDRSFCPRGAIYFTNDSTDEINTISWKKLSLLPYDRWLGKSVVLTGKCSNYYRFFNGYEKERIFKLSEYVLCPRRRFYYFMPRDKNITLEVSNSDFYVNFENTRISKYLKDGDMVLLFGIIEGYALRFDTGKVGNLWIRALSAEKK